MKKEKVNETAVPEEKSAITKEADVIQPTPENKPAKVTKVGALLKEMRLQKGLKTPDISKKLCIRKCYLDAIEESNYKEIPAFPYGIGFIRSYANFLGLNGENIVELYKEETNIAEPKDMHLLEPQPEASMPGWRYLLVSLLAIAALYGGWVMYNQTETTLPEQTSLSEQEIKPEESNVVVVEDFNFEVTEEENSTEAEQPVAEAGEENQQISVSNDNYVEPQPTEKAEEVKEETAQTALIEEEKKIAAQGVVVEVLKETWVEVKDEHKLYISKVLQAGDTYNVPEGKGMILSVGKVDGVNVYINGTLTKVARAGKKTNIALDAFLKAQH